jgi:LemA protein
VSSLQIVCWVSVAAGLFWVVGAYNRLVGLRGAIVRQFAPVDEQFRLRHALLHEQLETLAPALGDGGPALDTLNAACQQAEAACSHAKLRPGSTGAIASLRLAEEILNEARARLAAQLPPGTDVQELGTRLTATDTTLAFARKQFNDAVLEYNHAVGQFPTALIVGLFGFKAAGIL